MRIQTKLFFALLATSILLVASMAVLMRWSVDRGMLEYINTRKLDRLERLGEQLAERYASYGDWSFLEQGNRDWRNIAYQAEERHGPHRDKSFKRPPKSKLAVLNADKQVLIGRYRPDREYLLTPIAHLDQTVGWVAYPQRKDILDGFELAFIKRQRTTLAMTSVIILVLAALAALILSRHFVRPIKAIADGAHSLALGNYEIEIDANRRDELGELARDFNELARAMADNDQSRKRWLADTSHELRTPISILKGELEAMLDGVRTINEENIRSAHEEVEQLRRLVNDLYELSNADIGALRYRKENINLIELVDDCLEGFNAQCQRANLQLEWQPPTGAIDVWADYGRLKQLLGNLLNNSCKYTDTGGQIRVTLKRTWDIVKLCVEDSAPGVPPDSHHRLFDHLYRVESSRNRSTGGSGLGLAICQRIAEAHDGTLQASPSTLGGLKIELTLPLLENSA